MAFRFVALVAVLGCVNMAVAVPHHHAPAAYPQAHGCPRPPLPHIEPIFLQSVIPAPVNIGPQAPGVIEHSSAPYEINYFEKPWIVKHKQSAGLTVFTQTPVVVDEYAAPAFNEVAAPPAVYVEEVCGAPAAPIYASAPASVYAAAGPIYAGPSSGYGHHAAPVVPEPCH